MGFKECDVLIVGAGMAGGCLARQLKLEMQDLKIIVIEKKKEFDYWIGESTVEVWTDYAYRKCGLGPYLHKNQILKTGLRFFFDSEKKDLPLPEMSEIGRGGWVSDICSHQLDRATFDRDLCELNKEIGIEVLLGVGVMPRADAISINGETGHTVKTDHGEIRCRWLVDAAGRTSPLSKTLNLTENDSRHPLGSYWGRFTGFTDMDAMGDKEWQKRTGHVLRYLSTNHFMYPGYWIWTIPVTDKILSIGVCFHKSIRNLKLQGAEDLFAFLREHRFFRDLLPSTAQALDFMGFGDCTRHAKQYMSQDRWFLTGMSGFVLDALFSTTGRTTALTNRLIGEVIKADRSGNKDGVKNKIKHFNIFLQGYYELMYRTMAHYPELGSFDSWGSWRHASQSNYFNVSVPQSTEDLKTFFDTVDGHKHDCDCSIEKAIAMMDGTLNSCADRFIREMHEYLTGAGRYFDGNKGQFVECVPRRSLSNKIFEPRDLYLEYLEDLVTYECMFRNFLGTMARYENVSWNESAFLDFFKRDWNSGQTIKSGLEGLRVAGSSKTKTFNLKWTPKSPIDQWGDEVSPSELYSERYYGPAPISRDEFLAMTNGKSKKVA